MDYIEFDLDSAVSTQSSIPEYSSLDAPSFTMGRQIQNVVGFKIIETTIPTSYYTVTNDLSKQTGYPKNRINIDIDAGTGSNSYSFDMDVKAYTGTLFASDFQAKLNSIFGTISTIGFTILPTPITIPCTCTYSTDTGKFTINMIPTPTYLTLTVTIRFDTTIAQMIGYQLPNDFTETVLISQTGTTFSFVSSYVALVSGPNYLHINSKFFSNIVKNYLPQGPLGTVGQTNEAICQVPVLTNFGGISCWQTAQPDSFNTQNLFQLEKFDLYLTLGTSKIPLKLNGLSWQCKIRVFIETNTVSRSMAGNVDQSRVVRMIGQT
jgi:hypothetical protein